MCGRFVVSQKVSDLTDVFDAEDDFPDWEPSYSIAPTEVVPIVRERADRDTSIITREAKDASGEIHDRMPVYLPLEEIDHYLDPVKLDAGAMQAMVGLLLDVSDRVAATITEYEVDPRVNNSRRVDPGGSALSPSGREWPEWSPGCHDRLVDHRD